MKCKICGARKDSLPAMGKHYRLAHPSRMKKKQKDIYGIHKRAEKIRAEHLQDESVNASYRAMGFKYHPIYGTSL